MNLYSRYKIGNERYPALTGIRALGAAAVFFAHLPFYTGFSLILNVLAFFFVLSGFLIVYMYYQWSFSSAGNIARYWINRFARIYPVYFLLVTIAICHEHHYHPVLLLKNYTLTHALFNNYKDILIQPSWSLTVEECFYALAPLIILLVKRFSFLVSFLAGVLLLLLALLISTLPMSFLHSWEFVFTTTFFGHFFEFYTGVWLAILVLRAEKMHAVNKPGYLWTIMGIIGTGLSMGAMAILYNLKGALNLPLFIVINNFIFPVTIVILYFGLISERTSVSKFLSTKLLGLLGRTSYSFYLLHILIIDFWAVPHFYGYFGSNYNLFVITTFLITQLLALVLFMIYEEPLNHFIRKIGKRK